jgi:DNA polymerase
MANQLQLERLKKEVDGLQKVYGNPELQVIYGAGKINQPKFYLLFMNPTARNISATKSWTGLRAPWLGTKNIWKILFALKLISPENFQKIQTFKSTDWSQEFCLEIYNELNKNSVYISNLAKCTQDDARALHDDFFKAYLENSLAEIYSVNPKMVISFGNQVSSILLNKKIKVSDYKKDQGEKLIIRGREFMVYPTFYPIGQGMRNLGQAIARIKYLARP